MDDPMTRKTLVPRITRQDMAPGPGGAMRPASEPQTVLGLMRPEAWDVVWYRARKALGLLKERE